MKKKLWIPVLAVILLAAGGWFLLGRGGGSDEAYRFTPVERGDVESVISSTGTLEAVETVEVGTQVSGIISHIYADFNDHVTKGQVIARLDTTLLAIAVRDAEASVERARAQLDQAQRDYVRTTALRADSLVSVNDVNTATLNLDVAKAAMNTADIGVERARRNLAYATIYAPISGTVIARDVDVGQTVAASLSAPRLFLIANDLSKMQILASVDESDIGRIRDGQTARFTVQAYPDRTFTGLVRQVRLQSATVENVVTYTVVVDVDNPDRILLPGMTATVDFVTAREDSVFTVANAALRFRPTEKMAAELAARRSERRAAAGGTPPSPPGGGTGPVGPRAREGPWAGPRAAPPTEAGAVPGIPPTGAFSTTWTMTAVRR